MPSEKVPSQTQTPRVGQDCSPTAWNLCEGTNSMGMCAHTHTHTHSLLNPCSHTHTHSWRSLRHHCPFSRIHDHEACRHTHAHARPLTLHPHLGNPAPLPASPIHWDLRVYTQRHLPLPTHTQGHSPSTQGILDPELKNSHLEVVLRRVWRLAAPVQVRCPCGVDEETESQLPGLTLNVSG